MTRFIRVDKLPKVCSGQYARGPDGQERPEWTDEVIEWYDINKDKVKAIHRNKDMPTDSWQFAIEFINEEEATMFAMRFA